MSKRVLMIAYHFPPLQGSSGIQRTLRFVQHLPKFNWEPLVLTANKRAYEKTSPDQLGDVPANTILRHAFALDTARHLSIAGRYPQSFAIPDRWASWVLGGVISGLNMVRRYRPQVIWSTYPIASAHVIGSTLSKLTGLPWVADFRDPMAQDGYPADPAQWRAYRRIELQALKRAAFNVFSTPGAAEMYARLQPEASERIRVIENGYDEETFVKVEQWMTRSSISDQAKTPEQRFILLHSGIIYPSERDPRPLFDALAKLKQDGALNAKEFCLRLRASAHDDWLDGLVKERGIADLVALAPPIPYREALLEMMNSDALLIMQASNCNQQIPAKLYEYLRSRKPVLALTDPIGDTATALRGAGLQSIVPLDNALAIQTALPAFIARVRSGTEMLAGSDVVQRSSREGRTADLAELFNQITSGNDYGR